MNSFFTFIKSVGLFKLSSVPIDIKTSNRLGPLEFKNLEKTDLILFFLCNL